MAMRVRRRTSWRVLVILVALFSGLAAAPSLAGGAAGAATPASASETTATPADQPGRGLVYGGMRRVDQGHPCRGAFELTDPATGATACTHGPDPAPEGVDVRVRRPLPQVQAEPGAAAAAPSGTVPCYGDGASGPRVQLVYARAANVADRYAQVAPTFQQVAGQVDDVFNASAAETAGARHVRYVTDASCRPVVANVVLSSTGDDNVNNTISELSGKGHNRVDRKYLVWVDANVYCGIAQIYGDDRPGQTNYNNANSAVKGMVARVDNGCWGLAGQSVEAHELMHNLGGVQTSAPRATPYSHCTDDRDRMCYNDGSGAVVQQVCPDASHENRFDCNHDDYFHTAPPAGSYLSTHWNTASSAFLAPAGSVSAWGHNGLAGLGNGTLNDSLVPVPAAVPPGVTAVSSGALHSLALGGDGTVWAWGWNGLGALGDGTTATRASPVRVPGLSGVVAISAGGYHSLAVKGDGTVWGWGWNYYGTVGDGTTVDRISPVPVAGLSGVVGVSAGVHHDVAVKADGTVWSWGLNAYGSVGDGTGVDRLSPVQVGGVTGAKSVAAGLFHSLAVKADGTVSGWGWNGYGSVGDGTTVTRFSPVAVPGLSGVKAVSAGFLHSLAVTNGGDVWAWGWNALGQVGDNTTVDRHSPVVTQGLSKATTVSGGAYHSAAIGGDGRAATWGWNAYGTLGDGTTVERHVPAPVPGPSTATSVAAGAFHTLMA